MEKVLSLIILTLSCFAAGTNGFSVNVPSAENETDTQQYTLSLWGENPAVVQDLNEEVASKTFHFKAESEDEKISLVLENMTCKAVDDVDPPRLLIASGDYEMRLCENISYTDKAFDAVNYNSEGKHYFEVTLEGDWTESNAVIVATAYKEVTSCSRCPEKTFCCAAGSKCKGETSAETKDQKLARCISKSLKCDNHPNCGMTCNADESYETCSYFYYDFNFGYMTLLAFTFLMLLPTAIVLLGCYHRRIVQLKRLRALEERRRQNLDAVTRTSPTNDRPPTYDEVHDTQEQPPCFCEAVKLPNQPATVSDATGNSEGIRTQNCTCGKNNTRRY